MRIVRIILLVVALLVGAVLLIGWFLPQQHVARRSLLVDRSPTDLWALLTNYADQGSWRSDVTSIVRAPDRNGNEVWVETSSGDAIPLETVEAVAPTRLVRAIADTTLAFGGQWVYELRAEGAGTRLTITEKGEVYSPLFRFVNRFVMGQASTIEAVLGDVARHTGSPTLIEK